MKSSIALITVVFFLNVFQGKSTDAENVAQGMEKRRNLNMLRLGRGYNRGVRGFHMLRLGKRDDLSNAERWQQLISSLADKQLESRQAPLPRYGRENVLEPYSVWDPLPRLGRFRRSLTAKAIPIPRIGRYIENIDDNDTKDQYSRAVPMPRIGKDISRRAMHMLRLGKRRMTMLRLGKRIDTLNQPRGLNMLRLGREQAASDKSS